MAKLEIKNTQVTPQSKAKSIPHPPVGRGGYPPAQVESGAGGKSISFIPKSEPNLKARNLPVKKP